MFRVQRVDPRQHEKLVEEESSLPAKKKEKKKGRLPDRRVATWLVRDPETRFGFEEIQLKSNLKRSRGDCCSEKRKKEKKICEVLKNLA